MNGQSFTTSESNAKVLGALAQATAELGAIVASSTANAGQYSYSYADLAQVIESVRPILAKHGLGFVQTAWTHNGSAAASTLILHTSGEWYETNPLLLAPGNNAQATGAALSYARRYSLMAALGLAVEDDDAASISPPNSRQSQPPPQQPAQAAPPAQPERTFRSREEAEIHTILDPLSPDVRQALRSAFNAHFRSNLAGLDPERHSDALDWVREQLAT